MKTYSLGVSMKLTMGIFHNNVLVNVVARILAKPMTEIEIYSLLYSKLKCGSVNIYQHISGFKNLEFAPVCATNHHKKRKC